MDTAAAIPIAARRVVVLLVLASGLAALPDSPHARASPLADAAASPPSRTASHGLRYVALGDSYSSGEGIAPFDSGTGGFGCHRSAQAFPRRLTLPGRVIRTAAFVACTGAVVDNIGRLGPGGALTGVVETSREAPALQLAALSPDAWRRVELVTVTIGGNDAGFGDTLRMCLVLACDTGELRTQILSKVGSVEGRLAPTYTAIRRTAPDATVVVLGYPQLLPARASAQPGCRQGLPRSRRSFIREATARLREIISRETRRSGVHFIDLDRTFEGHEPCGRKADWMFGLQQGLVAGSFHPNVAGQRAYARAVRSYLGCLAASTWPRRPSGLPANPKPGRAAPSRCTP